ncbi:unnamed protein product [Phytophthora lilii]|uniref:Unnamed protein product n=1 Tax=Phytophthora lilii TaxID=2077276 RepID=A0A9W6TF87_9STRA|nr:unnamed protein product [Phytophthora lilii]
MARRNGACGLSAGPDVGAHDATCEILATIEKYMILSTSYPSAELLRGSAANAAAPLPSGCEGEDVRSKSYADVALETSTSGSLIRETCSSRLRSSALLRLPESGIDHLNLTSILVLEIKAYTLPTQKNFKESTDARSH